MANRGRPKGSKNKPKVSTTVATTPKKRGRPVGSKNKPKVASPPAIIEEKPVELTPEQKQAVLEYDLNLHIYRLMMAEPFFAAISRQVQKIATKSIPTAGVTVDPTSCNFVLYYNPEFFAVTLKNDVERLAVLKHEFYHLILEHVTSRKPADKKENKLWNIAADLAINSFLLQEIPQFCCIPGNGFFKDMPALQSSEWYFNELKKKQQEQKEKGNGGEGEGNSDGSEGQFDDHSLWDELSDKEKEVVREIAKEKLKHMMRKAVKEVTQNGNNWGTVSSEMKQDIMRRLEGSVDWKKVLRWFVKVSQRADKSNSIRRINKRYAYIHPGKRVNRQANIAISIDQSGSVSDDLLCAFFAQLNTLADIATFTVVPFDSSVIEHEVFIWKKKENKAWKRVACGGTDFDAPTAYVNDRPKFDGHIILTDLCAPKPRPSKCQRMWMTSREHAAQPYFQTQERIVAIEIKEER